MLINKDYEAVVIGAGHAGVESALALARMGIKTVVLTINLDSISFLACNPSIGGTAKSHLVFEIDALGGQMGLVADESTIQRRVLNSSKGPAVHSLRTQTDKIKYHTKMKQVLENTPNLSVRQAEVMEILEKDGVVTGVLTKRGEVYECRVVVVCTGVYLNSKIIVGEHSASSGPNGFRPANGLTDSLIKLGLEIRRFKTGTPVRIHADTVDFSNLEEQLGEDDAPVFSFMTVKKPKNLVKCHLTYTSQATHELILNNLDKAPMYTGAITSIGARYCPSIETKVVRFSDKDRHQIFLEPESLSTKEIYVQGLSTSMPIDLQKQMLHTVAGLENAHIMRDAYAIEYDCINSLDLYPTLNYKKIKGLYFAGQINGTSGYEEAAAQGIVAGINAALYLQNKEPLILGRDESYIGVLIDDLVTKGTDEPYRMMTSRAEYRLLLRQDNADLRLTQKGFAVGLATQKRYNKLLRRKKLISQLTEKLNTTYAPSKLENLFSDSHETLPKVGIKLKDALKRNNINMRLIAKHFTEFSKFPQDVQHEVEVNTKYEGYLSRQEQQIKQALKLENFKLPQGLNYATIKGLRIEAQEKLNQIKPVTMGQASRISGVSPSDIAVLTVYFKQ